MSSGERHSFWTCFEDHESLVVLQFGRRRWSFDNKIVSVPRETEGMVKFIDGWELHVGVSIWKFIWTTEDRESPTLVGRFSTDRWFVAQNKKCEDSQHKWIVGKLD